MDIQRIKEIQQKTAYPNSKSVCTALLQVWHEVEHTMYHKFTAPTDNEIKRLDELCGMFNDGELTLSQLICRVWNTALAEGKRDANP